MEKRLFIFIAISIFFFSCESEKTPKNLTTVEKLKEELKADSGNIEIYYELASALYEEDSYSNSSEALEYLMKYESKGGDEYKLCLLAATIYDKNIENQKAISYYKRLAKVSDDSCNWYNRIASLSYYRLDSQKAKENLVYVQDIGCLNKENENLLRILKMDYSTFENEEYKISFKYPAKWKTDTRAMPDMYFFEAVENNTGMNFNITIASDQNAKLNDWKDMINNELEKEGVEILSSTDMSVNKQVCYFISVKRAGENNTFFIQNSYVLLKNGYAFMMNFTSPESIYNDNAELSTSIVRSVIIN